METIIKTLTEFNLWSVIVRVALAALCGGLVGSERGRHGRAAGMRTHILVCLGAAMASLLGVFVTKELEISSDASRIAAQVISGIGFLGVGTIIVRNRSQVTGLTTAAGLWASACMGLAIGAGFYTGALIGCVLIIATTALFSKLERRLFSKCRRHG